MKQKIYEKTGIKEEKNKKAKLEEVLIKKIHEEEIQKGIARGIYKEQRKDYYNINLMNFEKEYKKIDLLLNDYCCCIENFSDNTQELIKGYSEYFYTYGNNMSSFGLRTFRKGVIKTILISERKQLEMKKCRMEESLKLKTDEVLLDFCVQYFDDLTNVGMNMEMTGYLMDMLETAGAPITGFKKLMLTKNKVAEICTELM